METPSRSPARMPMSPGGLDTTSSELLGSPGPGHPSPSKSGTAAASVPSTDLTLYTESAAFEPGSRLATLRRTRWALLRAARELASRGLFAASKWAVEQVMGMRADNVEEEEEEAEEVEEEGKEGGEGARLDEDGDGLLPAEAEMEDRAKERREEARLLLAKAHFDLKDFGKAARALEPHSALDEADTTELSLRYVCCAGLTNVQPHCGQLSHLTVSVSASAFQR